MSKGARKPKLRDYSRLVLTPEERSAVLNAATDKGQHSIVTAILGYVLVEHELDRLLRRRLQRKDDATWERLSEETGPLRSFHSKIELAHALGTIDEKTRKDLHIVRAVRNAFAHSKKLLDFDDNLIRAELLAANCMREKIKKVLRQFPDAGKAYFAGICLRLTFRLSQRYSKAIDTAHKRALKQSSYVNALLPFLDWPYQPRLEPPRPASQAGHSGDPKSPTPLGLLSGMFPEPPKNDDSKGK